MSSTGEPHASSAYPEALSNLVDMTEPGLYVIAVHQQKRYLMQSFVGPFQPEELVSLSDELQRKFPDVEMIIANSMAGNQIIHGTDVELTAALLNTPTATSPNEPPESPAFEP